MKKTDTEMSDVQRDIERARQAAKRRMTAPEISLATADAIPQEEMLKVYCPECFDSKDESGKTIKAKWHAFTDEAKNHELHLDQGYEPVVRDGVHVNINGDLVYRLPMPLHERNMKANILKSNRMLGEKAKEDARKAVASRTEGGTLLTEDEYTTKQIDGDMLNSAMGEDTQGDK